MPHRNTATLPPFSGQMVTWSSIHSCMPLQVKSRGVCGHIDTWNVLIQLGHRLISRACESERAPMGQRFFAGLYIYTKQRLTRWIALHYPRCSFLFLVSFSLLRPFHLPLQRLEN